MLGVVESAGDANAGKRMGEEEREVEGKLEVRRVQYSNEIDARCTGRVRSSRHRANIRRPLDMLISDLLAYRDILTHIRTTDKKTS